LTFTRVSCLDRLIRMRGRVSAFSVFYPPTCLLAHSHTRTLTRSLSSNRGSRSRRGSPLTRGPWTTPSRSTSWTWRLSRTRRLKSWPS
jgi:hypothetical protein